MSTPARRKMSSATAIATGSLQQQYRAGKSVVFHRFSELDWLNDTSSGSGQLALTTRKTGSWVCSIEIGEITLGTAALVHIGLQRRLFYPGESNPGRARHQKAQQCDE